jgi:hypothetical protein
MGPPDKTWTWVKTAHEAIAVIKANYVEELVLDHDLGPPEAGTGYDVALYIEKHMFLGDLGHEPPKVIRIYSANNVGRQKLQWSIDAITRSSR